MSFDKHFMKKFLTITIINALLIKTHGSESWCQEEAGRMRLISELVTGSTVMKLAIALNKPP